ncbi:hypothetical protein MYX78_09635 [Acidobacteria bacterium AH-259-G07]|nr:hypothetical protein [Acidobacteria bacterium AH-259-G07]
MNKKMTIWAVSFLVVLTWGFAQILETGLPHDLKQVRHELDIMEGILQKTLSFAGDTGRRGRQKSNLFEGNIHSFYLNGQGALFTIDLPILHQGLEPRLAELEMVLEHELEGQLAQLEQVDMVGMEAVVRAAERLVRSVQHQLERELRHLHQSMNRAAPVVAPAPRPPEPPPPPGPPAPPAPQGPSQEEIRARLAERKEQLQERVETMRTNLAEQRKTLEEKQAELQGRLDQVKVALVEALARHGDSLTIVASNEYVTLILNGGEPGGFRHGHESEDASVLSVKKSDIVAFSKGELAMAEFKGRVQHYKN